MKILHKHYGRKALKRMEREWSRHFATLGKHGAGHKDKLLLKMQLKLMSATTLNCNKCKLTPNICALPYKCRGGVSIMRPIPGIMSGGFIFQFDVENPRGNTIKDYILFIKSKVPNAKIKEAEYGESRQRHHFRIKFVLRKRR